jgi:ferredoxin
MGAAPLDPRNTAAMADKTQRWEDNVAGRWYVDQSCILCSLCSDLAPKNFRESQAGDHDVVYKQPENDVELAQSEQAKQQCPVEAIGSDSDA